LLVIHVNRERENEEGKVWVKGAKHSPQSVEKLKLQVGKRLILAMYHVLQSSFVRYIAHPGCRLKRIVRDQESRPASEYWI